MDLLTVSEISQNIESPVRISSKNYNTALLQRAVSYREIAVFANALDNK